MNKVLKFLVSSVFLLGFVMNAQAGNISGLTVKDIDLNDVKLADYKGKVLLIVNVASKCGFTRQYAGLQKIYETYNDQGFEILGFPCNDFAGQEPGTNEEIQEFCSVNFNVTFKLFDKITLQGENKSDLFAILTDNETTGTSPVKWNFEKFIIDKNGNIYNQWSGLTSKEILVEAINKLEEI